MRSGGEAKRFFVLMRRASCETSLPPRLLRGKASPHLWTDSGPEAAEDHISKKSGLVSCLDTFYVRFEGCEHRSAVLGFEHYYRENSPVRFLSNNLCVNA
ncbi:hypothetical protein XENOCAPTIV_021575 [Xenoophorus captivus]|uniref:Uncharacterized protein n=1 Tax=Xenoophorus captivus TaxID=1517983 RepID=A0ABV0RSS3_9TELE